MSTRSGRRIHGSIHEPEVASQEETVAKGTKKTRNKRVKDNVEVLETTVSKSKKRNNYVSYPSDEEVQGALALAKDQEEEPARAQRKTALKEQNLNVSSSETTDVDGKKPARLTRRTKKFAENEPEQKVEEEVPDTIIEKKGKKNKKKKSKTEIPNENEVAVVSKKKSKRKKKKSNQESNSEVKTSTLNGSKMSIDSFHSAAGSPVHADSEKLNTTFDKSPEWPKEETKTVPQSSDRKRRRSSNVNDLTTNVANAVTESNSHKKLRQNSTFEVVELLSSKPTGVDPVKENTPNKKRLTRQNSTFEVIEVPTASPEAKETTPNNRRLTRQNTFDITEVKATPTLENSTQKSRRSSVKNSTFDATNSPSKGSKANSTFDKNKSCTPSKLNTTFETDGRRKSLRLSSATENKHEQILNGTFNKNECQSDELNSTFDKETKLNTTFDKEKDKSGSIKSSLITSDDTDNLTFDKSDERISITSDDSRIENTTPVLIESSMDESHINTSGNKKSPKTSVLTPMKREGTFTKEESDVNPKVSMESVRTPTKRISLATPGSTPFPFSKSGQKEKALLNVTRSIEKSRLSFIDAAPSNRTTKVMFCSPVNNPVVVAQQKRKVIKSNLKGSNKSFVFEETASSPVRAAPRKRSYTHNDVEEARAKRFRHDDQQQSIDRLSRPRTSTTAGKANEATTPSKRIPTPSKSKSESKVSRTKLPNFAALHQKRFQKMESLDECQERKAKRAKQLLTPSASIAVLERSSPRGTDQAKAKDLKKPDTKEKIAELKVEKKDSKSESKTKIQDPPTKSERPEKVEKKRLKKPEETGAKLDPKTLTLDSLSRGYTRFGFKMNIGVNPFSVPSNVPSKETKPKEEKPKNGFTRQVTQPSLAGATGARKEEAKQLVLREKSVSSARRAAGRSEARTRIKGVRTNRRFELQMQMRNIS